MKVSDTGGGDFVQAPVGNHPARCIKVIDIGTQEGEYQGKANFRRQIVVFWELPNTTFEKDGKEVPFIVSKFYTASIGEKANLRKDLVNWRGRDFTQQELMGFDIANILGKTCLVQVTHSEKGKAKVTAVSGIPKGFEVPPQVNQSFYLSLEKDEFDQKAFDSLSDYWKGKIQTTPEWETLTSPKGPVSNKPEHFDDMESDIPF